MKLQFMYLLKLEKLRIDETENKQEEMRKDWSDFQ